jgi:UDP-N-acetylglucosamine 1-carboxyvinyltransferase
MDKFVVEGPVRLEGTVETSGAKNAALPILVATLLTPDPCRLTHVPRLRDIGTLAKLLQMLGTEFQWEENTLTLATPGLTSVEAPYDLVKTMRASIYVLGPLLARAGSARVSLPGGCAWGPRPVDLHLKGMEALGATIAIEQGYILAETDGLVGTDIHLDIASVGATGNLMMAAVGAKGTTRIRNAAREPEMPALADFLNAMGARISGAGSSDIVIEGGVPLHGAETAILPDRIEAGTFLVAGAITGGDVTVTRCRPDDLTAAMAKLADMGATVTHGDDWIRVQGPERPRAADITTDYHPGFPTDLQAQFMALAAVASGTTVLTEKVYHDRFTHVAELVRLGARIRVDDNVAVIEGVDHLSGARVMATDLRASAALVLAGCAARGETHVSRVYHIDRGYERIERKLGELGAKVRREDEPLVT